MSSRRSFDPYALATIDTSLLESSNPSIRKAENDKLYNASCTVGAFYMTTRDFDASQKSDEFFKLAHEFMLLSKEEKMQYYRKESRKLCGYCPDMSKSDEILDKLVGDLNRVESYSILGHYDAHTKRLHALYNFDNFMVTSPKGFSNFMDEWYNTLASLAGVLMHGYASALDVPVGTVQQFTQHPGSVLRVHHYSSNDLPTHMQEVGIPGHTDFQWLTIILQDHNPGLQIEVDGMWYDVQPTEGCFIVLVDEQAAQWTHGRLRACPHRVLNTSGIERYSLIFLYTVDHEKTISVVSDPQRTQPLPNPSFIPGDYIEQKQRDTFGVY